MKSILAIGLLVAFAGIATAQPGIPVLITTGFGPPTARCDSNSVIRMYKDLSAGAPNASLWSCDNTGAGTWAWELVSGGGGGGGGASATYQLTDLLVTRTSATVLTIGAGCAPSTPCNVHFGDSVVAITSSTTAPLTSGTGTLYVWADSTPTVKLGIPASGMAVTGSITATSVPAGGAPIFKWTATSGSWDVGGGTDLRAFQGAGPTVAPGTGCTSFSIAGSVTTINCPGTGGGGYTPQYHATAGADLTNVPSCTTGTGWSFRFNSSPSAYATAFYGTDNCGVIMNSGNDAYATYDLWWDGSTALVGKIRWMETTSTPGSVTWSLAIACRTTYGTAGTFSTPVTGFGTPSNLLDFQTTTITPSMGSCSGAQLINVQVVKLTSTGSGNTAYAGNVYFMGLTI